MLGQRGSTSATGNQLDQIAASVAPPKLTTRVPGKASLTWSGSETGIQSPESRARRRGAPRPGPRGSTKRGTSCCKAAGAESQIVRGSEVSRPASRSGSRSAASGATWIVAPAARVPNTSYTERSKHGEVTNSSRSPGPTPKVPLTQRMRFTTGRCCTTIPLGTPVEPEVWMT